MSAAGRGEPVSERTSDRVSEVTLDLNGERERERDASGNGTSTPSNGSRSFAP